MIAQENGKGGNFVNKGLTLRHMSILALTFVVAALTIVGATGCSTSAALAPSAIDKGKAGPAILHRDYTYQGEASMALTTIAGIRSAVVFTHGDTAYVAINQKPHTVLDRGNIRAPEISALRDAKSRLPHQNSTNQGTATGLKVTLHNPLPLYPDSPPNGKDMFARLDVVGTKPVTTELYHAIKSTIQSHIPLITHVLVASDPTTETQFTAIEHRSKAGVAINAQEMEDLIRRTWQGYRSVEPISRANQ